MPSKIALLLKLDACGGTQPVCSDTHTCRACTAHSECAASNACLPDGSCAAAADVAYVDPAGTDNTSCSRATPCTEVAKALATARRYVKFKGTTNEQVVVSSGEVTFLADPGAKLTDTSNGILLRVEGAARLSVYDLEITGASGVVNPAVSLQPGNTAAVLLERVRVVGNAGIGIAASGGTLRVHRSTILNNQGGGISVSGVNPSFQISNSFIVRNGDPDASVFGGAELRFGIVGSNRFEFNTVVDNRALTNSGGVVCNVAAFMAPNNIVARNALGTNTADPDAQESGACTYPTSRIQNDVIGLAFIRPDAAPFDYKIATGSVAVDQATTPSEVVVDNEGDLRPQGAAKDIGADELRQPP